MNNQIEAQNETRRMLETLAVHDLEQMEDTERAEEILAIFNTQVTGGEFLGGNGKTSWGQVGGKDSSDTPKSEQPEDIDYYEAMVLALNVTEHQSAIEINGNYNVRQLARWKRGYSPKLALKASEERNTKLLQLRVTDAKNRKLLCPIETAKKKAKSLARLQKRMG